jgi:hypothetical protein
MDLLDGVGMAWHSAAGSESSNTPETTRCAYRCAYKKGDPIASLIGPGLIYYYYGYTIFY